MAAPLAREDLGPGLTRYVFASGTRPGLTHELLHDATDGTMSCLCEAGLLGRDCKHQRYVRALLLREEKDHPPAGA